MERLLRGMRALAEPTRLRILCLCTRAELSVSELSEVLGQSQPRVSRHLKLLVEAGILDRNREGTWAYYRPTDDEAGFRLGQSMVRRVPADDPTLRLDLERLEAVRAARAARAREYFRRNSSDWKEIRALYVNETEVEQAVANLLGRGTIRHLLDIGTGTGRMLELLGPMVKRGIGVDLSQEMLALARANLDDAGLNHCQVRKADMYRLPLDDGSFDAVTVHMVLHFADQPGRVISEAARVLRPGGNLIVVDFAPHREETLRGEHAHAWLGFSDREIARWFDRARLAPGRPVHLPGDPLTVCLWPAVRPPADRAA